MTTKPTFTLDELKLIHNALGTHADEYGYLPHETIDPYVVLANTIGEYINQFPDPLAGTYEREHLAKQAELEALLAKWHTMVQNSETEEVSN